MIRKNAARYVCQGTCRYRGTMGPVGFKLCGLAFMPHRGEWLFLTVMRRLKREKNWRRR